ncbi:MAG TPA: glutathione transferase GstA [Burkholderiaceae bacterium]|nr:glutathione transferase GstA [Burkholderiaceae bacterium]
MKLYYSPGACSLSPHIVMREAGIPVHLVKVDSQTKKTEDGTDFRAINSKGYVPTLELPDGQRLTEGAAIVQYLADQVPARGLAPANGTFERVRLQEWLNFISTEVHKQLSPLFDAKCEDTFRARQHEKIGGRFDWISKQLGSREYLMGSAFTVADAYLYTILSWTRHLGIDLPKWPVLSAYVDRIGQRATVREALKAEGLLKQ